jgi:hypothetical protein
MKKPKIGDEVEVTARPNDMFNHDFIGIVKGYHGNYITIEDQDENCWNCDLAQLEIHKSI